jgi:hypothetical protein
MTHSLARTLCTALVFTIGILPLVAQTDAVRHEEIQVKAPFPMPAIEVPVFPKKDFNVTHYNDGRTGDLSDAIRKAIAACHDAGGGRVVGGNPD